MPEPFTYICCAIPGESAETRRGPVAHMAWVVGPGLTLLSSHPGVLRGSGNGLMVINDQPYDRSEGDPRKLTQECLYLCRSLGLSGLVCDFEQPVRRTLEAFVKDCSEAFSAKGYAVYVPERYADCHPDTRVMIPTALTSGSLPNRLRQAVTRFGANRIALDMERLSRDLTLPAANGNGINVPPDAISLLLTSRGGASFFSGELGARYFTYKDTDGSTHFVIYDDPGTFRYKTELAIQMGIREGFVLYPDMRGLTLI